MGYEVAASSAEMMELAKEMWAALAQSREPRPQTWRFQVGSGLHNVLRMEANTITSLRWVALDFLRMEANAITSPRWVTLDFYMDPWKAPLVRAFGHPVEHDPTLDTNAWRLVVAEGRYLNGDA